MRPGEFELIERYFAPLSGEGAYGLKDDAAFIAVSPGQSLAVTQDALAAGVHFFPGDPPGAIAQKALRVNLSDLAAKGATPKAFSLALGLPENWEERWVASFAGGLALDCEKYGVRLAGGDTFRAPGGPVISITAWGEIEPDKYRSRLGARTGDRLFVTGAIGDAALGLKVRQGDPAYRASPGARDLLFSYLLPDPPVKFAPVIAAYASASMDISDGFAGDLEKLARASEVDFTVKLQHVPFSRPVMDAIELPGALETALTGGDDFQFLFTVPLKNLHEFRKALVAIPADATELGIARRGDGKVSILGADGNAMQFAQKSFSHF